MNLIWYSFYTKHVNILIFFLFPVAINLIVQHIQDILNGGLTKRLNGYLNGHNTPRKRHPSESSSRPHWPALSQKVGECKRKRMFKRGMQKEWLDEMNHCLCVLNSQHCIQDIKRKRISKTAFYFPLFPTFWTGSAWCFGSLEFWDT